jgi:two-component system NtrC family sensor kinase
MSGKLLRFVAVAALVAGLIAVLAVLYAKSSSVDAQKKTQVEGYLRQLKQLDAEWNVDVLKSRMELNKNYDPLTSPLQLLGVLQQQLAREAQVVREQGTQRALSDLQTVFDEKVEVVDQFKTENAILKNSLRYVPTAVDELRVQIRDARRITPALVARLTLLEVRVNQTLNDVLKYNLLPDAGTAQAIEVELAETELADADYPEEIAGSVRNFLNHTRTILRQRVIENDVLARIAAMPMTEKIDQVGQVFDRDFAAALDESNRYRNYLVVYSCLLLALLIYIGSRLFRSYRIIARVNRELKHANETLEQRVRERTDELSSALDHLKESEAQLVQSEKMASLGQMVAGVAHEINTPLAYVRSSLETVESHCNGFLREFIEETVALVTLMRSADASEGQIAEQFEKASALMDSVKEYGVIDEMQGLLKDGVHGVDEISGIVVNLKNFCRLDRSQVARCRIEECIDSTLQLAKSVVANKRVKKLFAETLPISCAPSQINQVLLNLVTNAVQAIGEADDGAVTIVTRMQDAEHVAVDVIDNGAGIPDDVLPRIFDPFFTTKQVGQGTGLGLSIVYKIIEQHGGAISVHSKQGVGSKFTVTLPVEAAANMTDAGSATPSSALAIAA